MRILLVDDEIQVVRGVMRVIESETDDWEVQTALSGAEALERLESDGYNVVVSDMRMPGMDGAELLETIAKRYPNVLRVVLSGQADRDTVMRAIRPMHQYLAKPCDPQRLIDVIRKAEVFQETISSTELLDALGRGNCLASLPTIVAEVNRELESESGTSSSLSRVVSQDPTLCAKILQLANSAIFGLTQPVLEVEQGISILGTDMTRALALSLAVFMPDQESMAASAHSLFRHCFHVAGIAGILAKWEKADSETVSTAFSGGLLHDIGKLALMNAFEARFAQIVEKSAAEGQPCFALEMEAFGASHAGVGAYLLEMWGLPSTLIETVAAHHSWDVCSESSLACQIVYGANWIAHGGDIHVLQREDADLNNTFTTQLRAWNAKYQEEVQEDFHG